MEPVPGLGWDSGDLRHSAVHVGAAPPVAPIASAEGGNTPSTSTASVVDPDVRRSREVLDLVFGRLATRSFAVRFWDGTADTPSGRSVVPFTIVLPSPSALREMLFPPSEMRLAEAFVRGVFDLEGDLESAQRAAREVPDRLASVAALTRLMLNLLALPRARSPGVARPRTGDRRWRRSHSPQRDTLSVRAHYDVGNEFYALWLDRRMIYSCAYFETGEEDIEAAQQAKLEHLCRKLRLRPGERLLDIGCGWGGLIAYAAAHYGVDATGITLSEAQASFARSRIAADGLSEGCRVVVSDYRALPTLPRFDKIVSVGMIEHVGRSQLPAYFQHVGALLAPGGLFLNQGIIEPPSARGVAATLRRWIWRPGRFMDQYVFPDGELLHLSDIVETAEMAGFETRDVESLREHYARTLRLWVRRLDSATARATRLVGTRLVRVWRLYMAASAQGFAGGRLGLAQVLFAKPGAEGAVNIPATRGDLYVTPATMPTGPRTPVPPTPTSSGLLDLDDGAL